MNGKLPCSQNQPCSPSVMLMQQGIWMLETTSVTAFLVVICTHSPFCFAMLTCQESAVGSISRVPHACNTVSIIKLFSILSLVKCAPRHASTKFYK